MMEAFLLLWVIAAMLKPGNQSENSRVGRNRSQLIQKMLQEAIPTGSNTGRIPENEVT